MALALTDQPTPSGNDTTSATSYPTGLAVGWASWTPGDDIVYALVVNSSSAANLRTPTLSGNGLVWTQIQTVSYDTAATPTRKETWFYAPTSGASAGQITATFTAGQTGCLLVVCTAVGVDMTNSGANSFRNVVTNLLDTNGPTASCALAAFLTTNNAVLFGCGVSGTVTLVADALQSGYTLATQQGYVTPSVTGGAEWRLTSDMAPQITFATNHWGAIGFELVASHVIEVAFDAASTSTFQAAASTYSWSHTVSASASSRALIVTVKFFATGSVSSITYNSIALSNDASSTATNGVFSTETWYLANPDTGTHTITVTLSASLASIAEAASYYNVDQTTPIEARATNTGTGGAGGGNATVAVTTLGVGSMVVGSIASGISASLTSVSIQNVRESAIAASGDSSLADSGAVLTPASITLTWQFSGSFVAWAASVVSLQAARVLYQPWYGRAPVLAQ